MRNYFVCWLVGLVVLSHTVCPQVGDAQDGPKADAAADLYFGANGLYNRKLYGLAAEQYELFLKTYPRHEKAENAQLGLGLSRFSIGDYEKAEPILRSLSSKKALPQIQQVRLMHAQALLKLKRLDDARKAFDVAAKGATDPGYRMKSLAGLIEVAFQQKDWEVVADQADTLLKAKVKGAVAERARYQVGLAHIELKQFEQATAMLRPFGKELKESTFAPFGYFMLGESLRAERNLGEAAKVYEAIARDTAGPYAKDAWFLKGFCEFKQDDFSKAVGSLTPFVQKNKEHASVPRALVLLGRSFIAQKNWGSAQKYLQQAQKIDAVAREAGLWLGRSYTKQKNLKKAEQAYEQAVKLKADTPGSKRFSAVILYELGNVKLGQEGYAEAADVFQQLVSGTPDFPLLNDALRQQAYALHRSESYLPSIAAADAFLTNFSEDKNAYEVAFIRAESLFLSGKKDPAGEAFAQVIEQYPDSAHVGMARLRAGQIAFDRKDWKKSIAWLQPIVGRTDDPAFRSAGYLAGAAAFKDEQWGEAINLLKGYVEKYPKEPQADVALLSLGMAYQRSANPTEAVKVFEQLGLAHPGSAYLGEAFSEGGRLAYEAKDYATAKKFFEATRIAKVDAVYKARASYYLGWVAQVEDRPDDALASFTRVTAEFPDALEAADALLQQGLIALNLKKFDLSVDALTRFTKKYPEHEKVAEALYQMGLGLIGDGKGEQASEALAQVVGRFSESPRRIPALYEMAWIEKEADRAVEAIAHYRTLLSVGADHDLAPAAQFELAELLYKQEQLAEASEVLLALLKRADIPSLKERALFRLGWCYFDQEKDLDAAKTFERLTAEFPEGTYLAAASFQAGESRLKLKEFEAAYQHVSRAEQAERKTQVGEQTLLRLGETAGLTRRWEEAERAYDTFLRAYSDSDFARRAKFGLGWARENTGKFDPAIAEYAGVVALGIKDETAARCQFQIGECLLAQKKWDEAVKAFNQVVVNYAYPTYSAKALLEMGHALQQKGDPEAAAARFSEVISTYPESEAAAVAKDALAK